VLEKLFETIRQLQAAGPVSKVPAVNPTDKPFDLSQGR